MSYLLFAIYIIGLSWCVTKIPLMKNSGLGNKALVGIFLCKVAAGVIAGVITEHALVADSWIYHRDALVDYHILLSNPGAYVTNIFDSGYADKFGGVLQFQNSYWNDLKTNLIVKLISLLDIFSGGRYYVNVVLFNFLVFLGCMGLFRVYQYRNKCNKYLLAAIVFLLPSTILFSSSIHKDGLIAAALGLLMYCFYRALYFTGFTIRRTLLIAISFVFIFLFRNYVAVMLIPALVAMALAVKTNINKYVVYTGVYLLFFVVFFNISHVISAIDPPQLVVQKQADFFNLAKANSYVDTDALHPAFKSFIHSVPQSFAHTLARPFITDYVLSKPLLPFAAELLVYQLLLIFFIVFKKEKITADPLLLFGLFFGLSILLIIGYTVPVIWAIIRYRSIYLPFLLLPLFMNIEWQKIPFIKRSKKLNNI